MGKIYDRFRTGNTRNVYNYGVLPVAPPPKNFLPDTELKGVWQGNCNITSCQMPGATWWNFVMKKYYCPECARDINRFPMDDGTKVCSPGTGKELIEENEDESLESYPTPIAT